MAPQELNISAETQLVLAIIKEGRNFLLSGGAGSGKTYSLVETIRSVLHWNASARIACITYTNAAANEIAARVNHGKLHVSTIHDFLWENIKHYQVELKKTLLSLIRSEDEAYGSFKLPDGVEAEDSLYNDLDKGIQYKEYVRLKEGIVSHDEVLILAWKMYQTYPKLCGITKDRYQYIFVDEYQDTAKPVIDVLLTCFKSNPKPCIIGFFGDAMQSIYDGSIGNLDSYKGDGDGQVLEVKKEQNRRNPRVVIELANKIRTDGITQYPSHDPFAPNMKDGIVKEGNIKFLYSSSNDLDKARDYLGWDGNVKELNLTHNLIANEAGFSALMDVYDGDKVLEYVKRVKRYIKDNNVDIDFTKMTFKEVIESLKEGKQGAELSKIEPTSGMQDYINSNPQVFSLAQSTLYTELASLYIDKEQLLDDKKDDPNDPSKPASQVDYLIKHLRKIQYNIHLYQERKYNEFIRVTDFNVRSVADKKSLREAIDSLINIGNKTIGQVITEANDRKICIIDDRLELFKKMKSYIYKRVENIPYVQFKNLFMYLEGYTPFSTQHKTKGAEFANVLVILDNGRWNSYNFKSLFEEKGTESVLNRTRKIFYVCCTRAMENLAVFYHNPPQSVLTKANEWFGNENVVNLDI